MQSRKPRPHRAPRPGTTPAQPARAESAVDPSFGGSQQALREHTVFVRGTYSENKEEYFAPGVVDAANEHFGSTSSEDFDWYRGPLSGISREVAGRKLLREQVTPAFERGEKVNLMAHSHGGNVVGEMAGAFDERMGYLARLLIGVRDGGHALEEAHEAIAEQRAKRAEEKRYFTESFAGDLAIDEPTGQLADLEEEEAQLQLDERRLEAGHTRDFERELSALRGGSFGDVMNLNTPYLERHDAMTDVPGFASRVDRFTDASNPEDTVVAAAGVNERMLGGDAAELPDHERLDRVSWTLNDESALRPVTNVKRRHSELITNEDAFRHTLLDGA